MADVNRPKAVALVSGSNRGIGAAIASELIEHGYAVSLGARRTDELEAAHGPEDDSRIHAEFDAFRPETAKRWVDMTADRFGRINALINNAGSAERVRLDEDNEEALDRLWTVNVTAPLRLVRLCLPHLERCGRGRIVNIVSLSGKRVRNSFVGYRPSLQ